MNENHTGHRRHLDALAAYVKNRREDAEMGMREAAERARISPSTWNNLEQGRHVRGKTYARVDRALGLPVGTCRDIALTGSLPPRPVPAPTVPAFASASPVPAPPVPPALPAAPTPAVAPAPVRLTRMIEVIRELPDVPEADRAAITASMTAALAHMQARPAHAQGFTEVG